MVVVDANVLVALGVPGALQERAFSALRLDDAWHAPSMWRHEVRNVMATQVRLRMIDRARAVRMLEDLEGMIGRSTHFLGHAEVLELAAWSGLSAYDAEYVALALVLDCPLVTQDRAIQRAFPRTAYSLDGFVGGRARRH